MLEGLLLYGLLLCATGLAVFIGWRALVRVGTLEDRLSAAEKELASLTTYAPVLPQAVEPPPLSGMRVALAITQDMMHPSFPGLLRECLLAEDVALVEYVPTPPNGWPDGADLLIAGTVVCNGYAEVYYSGYLMCHLHSGPICRLITKPIQGDRPINLANELIGKLKSELEKLRGRAERNTALRELGS